MALLTVYFHAELEETGPGHSGKARPKNQRRPNDDIIHAHWSERILEFTSQQILQQGILLQVTLF
jgi:hypothetical protein